MSRIYFYKNNYGNTGISSQNSLFYIAIGFPAIKTKWRVWDFKFGISLNKKSNTLPFVLDLYITFWTITIFIGNKSK